MSDHAMLDGVVPVPQLIDATDDDRVGAVLDTTIGAGCQYYQFQTGDAVAIERPDNPNLSATVQSVQIEHGVTVWLEEVVADE